MDQKSLIFLSTLFLNCQNEKLQTLEQLPIPKIEIQIPENEPEEKLEEKVQPKGIPCTIDLSNHFIPELLSLSRDADQYFSKEGILQNPFQQDRFGIFSDFKHHQKPFEHYGKAIERRGNEPQPKIELKFIPYATEKTIKNISSLEQQLQNGQLSKNQKLQLTQKLETLQTQVQTIKNAQQILAWENFYQGEVNGIYDPKTVFAVMKYQRYHQQYLRYNWKIDGRINQFTRKLLNKGFEEYAFSGVHRVLEERVFHAKCNGRYPYVIEQQELDKLVDSAAEQLQLDSLQGVDNFFTTEHQTATIYLDIPERYQQDSMKLEVDVEKWDSGRWEKIRTKTNLRLYVIEGEERIELFWTKAVVGGWVKNKKKGTQKQYKTPNREFYLKSLLVMPHWNPPKWAAEEEVDEEEKLPGPFNAFGMLNTPLYYDNKPQHDPFRGWQDGDNGYRIHLTPWPSSVENGGNSHGCIRIHPNMGRFFYFVAGYTPHTTVLEDGQLKFTPLKGSYIPFDPEHYIKVRTCKEKCE